MIPDGFQYVFDDFWNFEKFVKIWTLGARIYYQHIFKIQESMGASWKMLSLYIWESKNIKDMKCYECYVYQFF